MRKFNLNISRMPALAILFSVIALVSFLAVPAAAQENTGEDINVHNNTGHNVDVFLFQDAQVHLDISGGVQFAHLGNGESGVAHVPQCIFSFVLIDGQDLWHAEFQDCNTLDVTFTPTTGYSKNGGH